jgi:hypothetical protein
VNHDGPATLGNSLQLLHHVPFVLKTECEWHTPRGR